MEPFLKLVASDLYTRFGDDLQKVTLVFPSHRSTLFFQKYLSGIIPKPIWLPKTVGISDLMYETSGLKPAEPILLIFKLYKIYCEKLQSQETFDSFYYWGNVMLADFDQIDKHRVNPEILFSNIRNLKEIDEKFGGFTPEQLESIKSFFANFGNSNSLIKEKYYKIWSLLGLIYTDFRNQLLNEGLCYEGLAYRIASDRFGDDNLQFNHEPIVFIGFNALNECEKSLFRFARQFKGALFYWDYDSYYLDNEIHEAGTFIRQNITEFPNCLPSRHFNNFNNLNQVNLVSSSGIIMQAKSIKQILAGIRDKGIDVGINTAIILPDENLLLNVLSSIPQDVGSVNITMGYPLKETPAYSLAECLLRLQISSKKGGENQVQFYYKDMLSLVNHPYIRFIDSAKSEEIKNLIVARNLIYVEMSDLGESSDIFKLILEKHDTGIQVAHYLLAVFNRIANFFSGDVSNSKRTDLEFVYSIYLTINKIINAFSNVEVEISVKLFQQLLKKVLLQQRVSFNGEPLEGLQVMGFLETRTLDFENLIVLSVNDDILPGKSYSPSFITPSLRYAFQLPDIKQLDSIYSYYFFRLLQRAKNIYLVYCNRAEGLSSGEPSRYAVELMYEKPELIRQVEIKLDLGISAELPIEIIKNEQVINNLNKFLELSANGKYLSPSALTNYILCPLRFYFRSIAGIKEPEEVLEEIDLPGFGQIIHKSMELVYKEIPKKMIEKADIETLISNKKLINGIIESTFLNIYYNNSTTSAVASLSGRNLLVLNQVKYLIAKMLQVDAKRTPFTLEGHEEQVIITGKHSINTNSFSFRLGGFIDRLEKRNGNTTILDYKTGAYKDKGNFKSIDDLFDPAKHGKVKEIFQMFTYCYILIKSGVCNDVVPQLWFVRNTSPDYLPNIKNDGKIVESFSPWFNDFELNLLNLIGEIYNPEIPFYQTKEVKTCKTCPYFSICRREL